MNANLAAILYLVSGVLFILALRGLSSPDDQPAGNRIGMIGMAIAVATALATLWSQGALDPLTLGLIVGGVAIGGGVGAVIARRVAMTAMPQLVAAFHSPGRPGRLPGGGGRHLHARRLRHRRGGRRRSSWRA